MDFSEAVIKSRKLVDEIESNGGQAWTGQDRFIQLVEEIGELANAMLVESKTKPERARKAEITDAICDCLLPLFMIAEEHGIDLDREYPRVLEHIQERNSKGEFRADEDGKD